MLSHAWRKPEIRNKLQKAVAGEAEAVAHSQHKLGGINTEQSHQEGYAERSVSNLEINSKSN